MRLNTFKIICLLGWMVFIKEQQPPLAAGKTAPARPGECDILAYRAIQVKVRTLQPKYNSYMLMDTDLYCWNSHSWTSKHGWRSGQGTSWKWQTVQKLKDKRDWGRKPDTQKNQEDGPTHQHDPFGGQQQSLCTCALNWSFDFFSVFYFVCFFGLISTVNLSQPCSLPLSPSL